MDPHEGCPHGDGYFVTEDDYHSYSLGQNFDKKPRPQIGEAISYEGYEAWTAWRLIMDAAEALRATGEALPHYHCPHGHFECDNFPACGPGGWQ